MIIHNQNYAKTVLIHAKLVKIILISALNVLITQIDILNQILLNVFAVLDL